jgi:hypothetical protein
MIATQGLPDLLANSAGIFAHHPRLVACARAYRLPFIGLDVRGVGPGCWKVHCSPKVLCLLLRDGLRGMPVCAFWNRSGGVHDLGA